MQETSSQPQRVPLSFLDLAIVGEGRTSADALADATAVARRADELGFARFWVAEHHNMASVASTSPAVLISHLAAATERMRVGSGGVMLPNHPPLVVAEQFAMLEALHAGRIDLGIGRAPGTDPATAAALRRSADGLGAEDFPRHLIELMGLLGDPRTDEAGIWDRFRATPAAASAPEISLLGSSGFSAQVAGHLGLPFAFAHHFDMGGTVEAAELYRRTFQPSPVLDEPHLIVTANVLAAPTAAEADRLAGPGRVMIRRIRSGRITPLPTPESAAGDPDAAPSSRSGRLVGTGDDVVEGLAQLARDTGADELMLSTVCYEGEDRITSLELIADIWANSGSA